MGQPERAAAGFPVFRLPCRGVFCQQGFLYAGFGFAFQRGDAGIAAVCVHLPGFDVVLQGKGKSFVYHALFECAVFYRYGGFYAAEKVASHPVCTGEVNIFRAAVIEVVHAGVFQQPPDDGAHADVVGQAGLLRTQGAHAAHNQINLHACRAGAV